MSAAAATGGPVRCSSWARSVGLSPIGTIGSYSGFLLVECPLPWPRDVGEIPGVGNLARPGVRIQALVPSPADGGAGARSVILYSAPNGPFAGYERRQAEQGESLAETVGALAASPPAGGVTDVLICTHGRRDMCCGSLGTELALGLGGAALPAGVRLRRTSHTGGHRFAPTFLVLPEGTGWAFASVELVQRVITRSGPFSAVAAHYRGCAGLPNPQVQALEREVLCEVGWELLDRPRSGGLTGETAGEGGVVVFLESGSDTWEAVVSPGRELPVPDCLRPLSAATKREREWVVSGLLRHRG